MAEERITIPDDKQTAVNNTDGMVEQISVSPKESTRMDTISDADQSTELNMTENAESEVKIAENSDIGDAAEEKLEKKTENTIALENLVSL